MTDPRTPSKALDRIHIRQLRFRCIIGVNQEERLAKQEVSVDLTLWADLAQACRSDDLAHTVDYKAIKKQVLAMAEQSCFNLIEALAQAIADICLGHAQVRQVRVCLEKPAALRFAKTVAVEILRTRGCYRVPDPGRRTTGEPLVFLRDS